MATQQADVQKIINTYVAAQVIARIRANAVLAKMVNSDFDDSDVKEEGDTIKVPKRGNLTVRDKVEGTAITSDSPATDTVDVVLDQHKYVSWGMGDLATSLASGQGIDYFTDAADSLIEAIEVSLLEEYANVTAQEGVAGTDLTSAGLLAIKLALDTQRCPANGRVALISHKDENKLLTEDKIVRADARGDGGAAFESAKVGRAYGFDIFASPLVPEVVGTPNETHGLAFAPGALALASRPLDVPQGMTGVQTATITDTETGITLRYMQGYDITNMRMTHVMDVLFGTKVLDQRKIVDILT